MHLSSGLRLVWQCLVFKIIVVNYIVEIIKYKENQLNI